ncbi:MAG: cell division protein FtsZ [Flavobacteriales bacterium]|nr:cell division protein FtsZ [Flavobacteriales bacterium]
MKEDFTFDLPKHKSSKIKVIGVGGGGSNAVNFMYSQGIKGVDFVICNTDAQALDNSPVPTKIQLGSSITEGLGAGANPEIGEQAAIETLDKIKEVLESNTKMIFITAGMGGGTGTGAAPVIAKCARDLGILTVGIVTVPFKFEGETRLQHAQDGIDKLRQSVDSLITINNNKLRELYGNLGYKAGFAKSDEILSNAAKGIAEIITQNYQVNIDLMDVKKVLANSGTAIMGSAIGEGPNRAQDAISQALDSPLLNDNKITGAKSVLLLIVSGSSEITMDEIAIINEYIQNEAGNNAHIIMGIGENLEEEDKISVMVVATGFRQDSFLSTSPIKRNLNETSQNEEKKVDDTGKVRYTLSDENTNENKEIVVRNEVKEEGTKQQNLFKLDDDDNDDDFSFQLKTNIGQESRNETQPEPKNSFNQEVDVQEEQEFKTRIEPPKFNTQNQNNTQNIFEPAERQNAQREEVTRPIERPKPSFSQPNLFTNQQENTTLTIEERRERLRMFNTKYHNDKHINELENTPAYMRQDSQFSFRNEEKSEFYFDDKDEEIKPNNFLNKNVD